MKGREGGEGALIQATRRCSSGDVNERRSRLTFQLGNGEVMVFER